MSFYYNYEYVIIDQLFEKVNEVYSIYEITIIIYYISNKIIVYYNKYTY